MRFQLKEKKIIPLPGQYLYVLVSNCRLYTYCFQEIRPYIKILFWLLIYLVARSSWGDSREFSFDGFRQINSLVTKINWTSSVTEYNYFNIIHCSLSKILKQLHWLQYFLNDLVAIKKSVLFLFGINVQNKERAFASFFLSEV